MPINEMLVFSGPEYAESCLDPKESFYPNISLAGVLRLLDKQESLWGANQGGAVLHWCFKERHESEIAYRPNPSKPSLVMLYNVSAGFHFRFDLGAKQRIACDPRSKAKSVMQFICGEPAYFPVCTFVSLAVAKGVVRKFVRDQETYTRLNWIDSAGFNYHDVNAWKWFDAGCRAKSSVLE